MTQVALASLALTTLTALGALVGQYVLTEDPSSRAVPPGLLAAAPLIPVALFALFIQAGAQAALRYYYLCNIEEQLASRRTASASAPPSPAFTRMVGSLVGLKHGNPIYRALTIMLVLIAFTAFTVITVMIAISVPRAWTAAMAVTYTAAVCLLFTMAWLSTTGQSLYRAASRRLQPQVGKAAPSPRERHMSSYLALPRGEDLQKSFYYVAGLVLAPLLGDTALDGSPGKKLVVYLWGWVLLEYLAYQARYQWNDIRGAVEDAAHPAAISRARLPTQKLGLDRAVSLSSAVVIFRIGAALVLALGIPSNQPVGPLIGVAAIFILAASYETARKLKMPKTTVALVGFGYPLRFCLGLEIAGYQWTGDESLLATAIAVAAFLSFGWSTVGLAWTLEAVHFAQEGIPLRAHHRWLLGNAGLIDKATALTGPPLATGYKITAVPNLAQLAAGPLAIMVGQLAADDRWDWWPDGVVVALALVVSAALMFMPRWPIVWGSTVVLGCQTFLAAGVLWPTVVATLLWLAFAGYYVAFRTATYQGLKDTPHKIVATVVKRLLGLRHWLRTGDWRPAGK
ncbi:hypothetical protein [Kribbella sindirgiensis]|uniref:Uncharacterized protein n=1 Tax=Kribbella sindirgiensis TaxID=1124744 RepID=A0A4R0I4U5_9ACTN|nr:hypothetical protein [Kribbella sindirgiensis]TCC18660.1 hypothetical protein E0H50_38750 [Kribbella sindirgiensis]